MSKLDDLKADLSALDEQSAPLPAVASLRATANALTTALERMDDEHADKIEVLQAQIKATVREHNERRNALVSERARYEQKIEEESRSDEPRQRALADLAQEIAKKYGKPLPELRQIVADAS